MFILVSCALNILQKHYVYLEIHFQHPAGRLLIVMRACFDGSDYTRTTSTEYCVILHWKCIIIVMRMSQYTSQLIEHNLYGDTDYLTLLYKTLLLAR